MKVSDEGKYCSKKPEIEKSELASAKSLLTISQTKGKQSLFIVKESNKLP